MEANKAIINLLVDVLTAILFLMMVASGYVLWFALPPGTNRTHALWGLLRHEWGTLHAAASIGLLGLVIVHVALHWQWLVTNVCKRIGAGAIHQRHPTATSLAVLAALVVPPALLAALATLSVQPLATPLHAAEPEGRPPVSESLPPLPPVISPDGPSLRSAAANVLAMRCASCHGANRTEGGIRADTIEALLAEQRGVRWVVPGDVQKSSVLAVVGSDAQRPPKVRAHLLSVEDLATLRRWIAALPAEPHGP